MVHLKQEVVALVQLIRNQKLQRVDSFFVALDQEPDEVVRLEADPQHLAKIEQVVQLADVGELLEASVKVCDLVHAAEQRYHLPSIVADLVCHWDQVRDADVACILLFGKFYL